MTDLPAVGPHGNGPALPLDDLYALLDTLEREEGRDALAHVGNAVLARHPRDSRACLSLARHMLESGRLEQAGHFAQRALDGDGPVTGAMHATAGRIAMKRGHGADALRHLRIAVDLDPGDAAAHLDLGRALSRLGRHEEAIPALEAAVNLRAGDIPSLTALGHALEQAGETDRAGVVLEHAMGLGEPTAGLRLSLGNVRVKQDRLEEAEQLYKAALEAEPESIGARINLGALYRRMRRFEQARAVYEEAARRDPNNAGLFYNYGNLLKDMGQAREAVALFERGLRCAPDDGKLHWNLSLALLALGDVERGFAEYEWRWQAPSFPSRRRNFTQPQWDGLPMPGRTLLVHTEQGMGDVLQFLRFLPAIVERSRARIVFECHEPLLPLVREMPGVDLFLRRLEDPLPDFDRHLPLMSAAYALRLGSLDDLPRKVPYIPPPDPSVLPVPEGAPGELRIGFVWGGNPQFPGDAERSTDLDSYRPLFDVPGTRFFSLQKGAREPELAAAPPTVVRLSDRIRDFRDTAAAMLQLDLVITTCTSVVHLAGALGRPVWVVLSAQPDWRWLLEGTESPWYPTARLFRQSRPGDWPGVFEAVRKALEREVAAHRA